MPTLKELYNFYINNIKYNNNKKEMIKNLWEYLSENNKIILRNIIILDKIKDMVITTNDDNKIKLLANIKTNNNYSKKIFSIIFKNIYDKKTNYLVNREIFLRKPLEEQDKIRKENNKRARDRYKNMTFSERRQFNLDRRNYYIRKNGLEQYKLKLREQYRNWYRNLPPSKLHEIKEKRKKRYDSLSPELKQKYNLRYLNKSFEERQILLNRYRKNRERNFEKLSEEEKNNKRIKMRNYKKAYFKHLSLIKRKFINDSRTLKRKLNNNQIEFNDYTYLKTQLKQKSQL